MSFMDGKPWVVTKEEEQHNWLGGANGKYFRCALCGWKFHAGDTARMQFTNNIQGAGGNPLVCAECDGPDVIERWKQMHKDVNEKYWWFRRGVRE